jgi:large subunit ribosomal protein L17
MRHRKAGLKLNRTSSHRDAMFRNMVTSLFKHERIRTTSAKAKELRRWADHMITLAKRGDLHARRQALAVIREKQVVHQLFEQAVDKFGNSAGGYTRIVKLGRRAGDAAEIALVELVVTESTKKKKTKKKSDKPTAAKKKTAAAKDAAPEKKTQKSKAATKTRAKTRAAVAEEEKPSRKQTAKKEGAEGDQPPSKPDSGTDSDSS